MVQKAFLLVIKDHGKEIPLEICRTREKALEEGYKQSFPFYVKEFNVM